MAYKINGVIRLADNGDANLGLVTATNINSTGVATATEFDGKVSKKAITEQTEGDDSNVTGADELLIYDQQTDSLLRVSVDDFISASGIGTLVNDFNHIDSDSLVVTGLSTIGGVEIGAGIITASAGVGVVTFYGDGSNLEGVITTPSIVSTTEPTTRPNGDDLEQGDLWFSSAAGEGQLRQYTYYNGAWIDSNPMNGGTSVYAAVAGVSTNVNGTGIVTASQGNFSGIVTAGSFIGDGSGLTGLGDLTGATGATGADSIVPGPQGSTGATGPKGDQGDAVIGATGSTGPQGDIGASGATGPKGDQGDAVIGATGPQGDIGASGATGPKGDQGDAIIGATGATGDQGDEGPVGASGATGPKGDQGDAIIGATGATGDQGDEGPVGASGATGPKGDQGDAVIGATGPQGDIGASGATGPQGDIGASGATGPKGDPGSAGVSATLTAGTYLSGDSYNGSTSRTWTVDATSANTASKVVARDASGNSSFKKITVDTDSDTDGQVAAHFYGANGSTNRGLEVRLSSAGSIDNAKVILDAKQAADGELWIATRGVERAAFDSGSFKMGANVGTSPEVLINSSGDATFAGDITAASFSGDGSGLTNLPGGGSPGDPSAASADKLTTSRTLWGQSFDGTANVSGNLTGVTNITLSGTVDGRNVLDDGQAGDNLITLSGVARDATNLGTFTGATISDNDTIKGALQDLETALESTPGSPSGPTGGEADSLLLAARNSTNATHYLTFATARTGQQSQYTDTGLTYNPSTNTLSATFSGNGSSLTSLNASNLGSGTIPNDRFPAVLPTVSGENLTNLPGSGSPGAPGAATIAVTDESSDTENFLVFTNDAVGNELPKTGSNLTFNASTGRLTATSFSGNGSSLTSLNASNLSSGTIPNDRFPAILPVADGSNLTNISRSDVSTSVQVITNNTANETVFITFSDGQSGTQRIETDVDLTYNPSTNTLSATFSGNGSNLTNLTSGNLVGALPAIDGSSLTGINAAKDGIFYENGTNVTQNYTITSGKNAMSAGPITINTGVTVTVPTGSEWTVV
ncbi:hypothetical protein BOW86_gp217 [Synechococcus phage S-CAM7]|uniref:Tail fiber protein n=1 Tax=Synechococcus phage S-CAM7 TaxID=1883368 RepID=A0A1D8KUA1_9CAUD|nr:hypothetical protein BOW86_gp217 [Synechococcus phage S-CAM7]AOV62164.1 hypothetical protein C490910_241 [Synechococcus phage S-CAM7]